MEKLAIHGVGMVGGALSRYFKEQGFDVREYDPPQGLLDDIDVDLHFISVPTPFDKEGGKGFLLDYVHQAVENIQKVRQGEQTVVVIKSTVLPGSTKALQEQYPPLIFLFNPEFLTEKTADRDMREPERQIVGYCDERGQQVCDRVMQVLPKAPYQKIMPATEAELVKYFGNTFLALKVIFANTMYDFCEKMGLDYELVKDGAAHDSRVGKSHLQVMHQEYRGYGGSCFPKDIRALIQLGDKMGVDVGILKEAEQRNHQLTDEVDR